MIHLLQPSVYTWTYIKNVAYATRRRISMFKSLTKSKRISDWVGDGYSSPILPAAPPRKNDFGLALNIDTYINYVDK